MTLVSHAQNFEDVMLWRALGHISCGFYIDIGANDPNIESVTRLFYDNGWRGINVEPLSHHHKALLEHRPEDINLQIAIGKTSGMLEIWEPEVRGWATAAKEVIQEHRQKGFSGQLHTVEQQTLAQLCEDYVSEEIHFLKIDVEGFEKAVLEGADFKNFRPWILVIEATKPNSTQENFSDWESLVTEADYLLAYCDGINRFYVSSEKSELKKLLRYPPNIFDNFKHVRLLQVETQLYESRAELKALQKSRSWRLTAPLRRLSGNVKRCRSVITGNIKIWAKRFVRAAIRLITKNPSVLSLLRKILRRTPWLKKQLEPIRLYLFNKHNPTDPIPEPLKHLSLQSRNIHERISQPVHKSERQ